MSRLGIYKPGHVPGQMDERHERADTTLVFMPKKAYACTDPRHYPPYSNAWGNPPSTGLSDVLFLP